MSLAQLCTLEIEGVDAALRVTGLHGTERVHSPWTFEVVCAPADEDGTPVSITPADVLTKPATLSWDLGDETRRSIEGVVDTVDASWTGLRFRLVPKVAVLSDCVDHRIFVDKTAVEVAEEVLSDHGVSLDQRIGRTLSKRPQCVQVFESDLAFVARIFAEEGLCYYLPLGQKDVLVVTDHGGGFDDVPDLAELRVAEAAGAVGGESVFAARLRRTLVSDKVSLRDYFFEKPMLDLSTSASEEGGDRERYEYPGRYTDPDLGGELAKIRLDQLRARKLVLTAETTCRRLSAGHVIALAESPREDMNVRWLVLGVEHTATDQGGGRGGEDRYRARFSAVPADSGFRPERPEAPELGGVQTATVSGASGAEIHTEKLGRVVVHHRWDRVNPADEKASAPARVVQPPLSGGFLLPRMGWESLVLFSDRTAEVPFAFGRLYNGQARPPNGLPGDKVVSAFGTQTTPGGGSANVVQMNDTAGNEGMSFTASKDFNEKTENTKNTKITADDTWTVGADRKLMVGKVLSLKVGASQTYTVAASRTVNTDANKMIGAASETVMIGGLRTFDIGGDLVTGCASLTRLVGAARVETAIEHSNRAVKGAQTVLVGGSWNTVAGASHNVAVSGASTEVVSGAKSIKASKYYLKVRGVLNETLASRSVKAGGDRQEGFGAAASYAIAGATKIQGSDVTVSAKTNITINAGGITITITPSSVTISGDVKASVDTEDAGSTDYE